MASKRHGNCFQDPKCAPAHGRDERELVSSDSRLDADAIRLRVVRGQDLDLTDGVPIVTLVDGEPVAVDQLEVSPDRASAATFKAPGKVGAKLASELLNHGVIMRAMGDVVGICPPMIITEDEIEELFAPMEKCLDATHAWAKAEGHLG